MSWMKKGYWGLVQGENFLGHFFLLIIRLYWGSLLVLTGLGKWMHIHHVADFFSSLDIPYPLITAYIAGAIEFLGGISLFLGVFTRIFTLLIAIVLCSAYATAHKESLAHIFTKPSEFIAQDPFLYLLTTLIVLCFGPGLFSIDYWLEKRSYGRPL